MERLLGHLADTFQHANPSLIAQTFRQSLQCLVDCPAITAEHFVGAADQLPGTLAQIIGTHQKVLEHGTTLTGANRAQSRYLINRHRGRRSQVIGRYWQPVFCFQHITSGHSFIVEIFQRNTDTTNELIRKNKRINFNFRNDYKSLSITHLNTSGRCCGKDKPWYGRSFAALVLWETAIDGRGTGYWITNYTNVHYKTSYCQICSRFHFIACSVWLIHLTMRCDVTTLPSSPKLIYSLRKYFQSSD